MLCCMNTLLEIKELKKIYGTQSPENRATLDDLDFSVQAGEFVAVMGPSGSGKTTLLNIIAGIDTPTSGQISINGQMLHTLSGDELAHFRRAQFGFVFQDYNLLDTLTLGENVVLPLLLEKRPVGRRLHNVLQVLGIADLERRFPYEVSGGQQQRAAVARAIIHNPALVLADEPSGNLDSKAATILLKTFSALNQQQGITFVMVTHDPRAASYARRVIFIKDGRLYQEIRRKDNSRSTFYHDILEVLARLEEDRANV